MSLHRVHWLSRESPATVALTALLMLPAPAVMALFGTAKPDVAVTDSVVNVAPDDWLYSYSLTNNTQCFGNCLDTALGVWPLESDAPERATRAPSQVGARFKTRQETRRDIGCVGPNGELNPSPDEVSAARDRK